MINTICTNLAYAQCIVSAYIVIKKHVLKFKLCIIFTRSKNKKPSCR